MTSEALARVGLPFQEASGCKAPVGKAGGEGWEHQHLPSPGARAHSACRLCPGLQTRAVLQAVTSVAA